MQRFLRKPVRVTLSTLLGVYRAVMRFSSIGDALNDAIKKGTSNTGSPTEPQQDMDVRSGSPNSAETSSGNTEELDGRLLLRKLLISPLKKV